MSIFRKRDGLKRKDQNHPKIKGWKDESGEVVSTKKGIYLQGRGRKNPYGCVR